MLRRHKITFPPKSSQNLASATLETWANRAHCCTLCQSEHTEPEERKRTKAPCHLQAARAEFHSSVINSLFIIFSLSSSCRSVSALRNSKGPGSKIKTQNLQVWAGPKCYLIDIRLSSLGFVGMPGIS